MTLSTRIRILGDVSPEGVFATARQIIGIPNGQPLTEDRPSPFRPRFTSEPGGFGSALSMTVALGRPMPVSVYGDEEPTGPIWNIQLNLDSTRDKEGTEDHLHRRICAELGQWLEGQGADWWAEDEYYGDWHHRTPAPIANR